MPIERHAFAKMETFSRFWKTLRSTMKWTEWNHSLKYGAFPSSRLAGAYERDHIVPEGIILSKSTHTMPLSNSEIKGPGRSLLTILDIALFNKTSSFYSLNRTTHTPLGTRPPWIRRCLRLQIDRCHGSTSADLTLRSLYSLASFENRRCY